MSFIQSWITFFTRRYTYNPYTHFTNSPLKSVLPLVKPQSQVTHHNYMGRFSVFYFIYS